MIHVSDLLTAHKAVSIFRAESTFNGVHNTMFILLAHIVCDHRSVCVCDLRYDLDLGVRRWMFVRSENTPHFKMKEKKVFILQLDVCLVVCC